MFVTHKNIQIHYTSTGKGPALLLLHGFMETSEMWNDFVDELSKSRQVICVDLLGHGKTECIGYIHSMTAMAEAAYAVLDSLKIETLSCIGHSMGGYVALALAELHSGLIEDLCLLNSTYEADDNERRILRARAAQMATTNFESLVRLSFTNLFTESSREKFKPKFKKALDIGLRTSQQGFIAGHKGMAIRPNRFEIFKTIRGKKVIVIGEKDWIVDKSFLIEKTKNTAIEIELFSEGHMSYIENKSELSYFLKRFIEI
ncbi:MAG: alpha/beta hydrolase [Winogradskyella sp.]|uniref:alpha/beta fold hydrolase n=1 Tax=Winogradskyella sp. TaxID=1883156 RepID=UPI0017BFBD98|nr:alpha/beta hydrolase [Winogradskyella sp.]MBT8244321.1 alpha/beta hydrolase [Winogradskyella sp.]NNK22716.1 alpha/beta hydrolase [Winogradskyella sp.]